MENSFGAPFNLKEGEDMENSFDGAKLPYELLPARAIDEVVQVLQFGAKKYAPDGWRELGREDLKKLLGAALRHVFAYLRGEYYDEETHIDHLAHASCDLLFIQELKYIIKEREKENGEEDNEDYKTSPA